MAYSMNPGKLNRRIIFFRQTTQKDAFGQPLPNWLSYYSCWADLDIQGSQLIYSTAEFIEKVAYRITIRYTKSAQIKPNDRIQYVDPLGFTHTYEIQSLVDVDTAHKWLTVFAYELNGPQ